MATTIANPKFKDSTNEELYVLFSKNKDVEVRNELMIRNQPLVSYILGKYYSNGRIDPETRQELMQEGSIGLLHAIEGFDHTLGWKFSTYGSWWVKQALNNYLINVNPIIRVPSHIKAAQNKLQKKLKLTNKDLADISDISPEDYDLSPKMLRSIRSALKSKQVVSFQKPIWNDGEGGSLQDVVADEGAIDLDQNLDREVITGAVKNALKIMPNKRRLILLLRYDVIQQKDIPTKKRTKQQ